MNIPAPFQSIFREWHLRRINWTDVGWTTSLRRHYKAVLTMPNGEKRFVKMAVASQRDLDEEDMRGGFQREVWFSQIIHQLRLELPAMPFTVPRVIDHNVNEQNASILWMMFEFVQGTPLVTWEPERENRLLSVEERSLIVSALPKIASAARFLARVRPTMLEARGLPLSPVASHSSKPQGTELGTGAFEIKNIRVMPDGTLMFLDNEFAGFFPQHHQLAYFYQRLWANTLAPDLARRMLREYRDGIKPGIDGFYTEAFAMRLRKAVRNGFLNDLRRRYFMPWHRKQRLRYHLRWILLRKQYDRLSDE